MSSKYPGGIISKTAPTPSGAYENSTASGIWTLEQQAYWQKLGQWPTAGNVQPDAQFNYVTMLLHGDGTNGAQNNTFLDGSTNNSTITRNGNTTQGSFSPYGSNWSNFFDGSSALNVADNAVFTLPADFTIECWFFQTGAFQDRLIISKWPTEYYIYTRADGVIGLAWGPYNASGMFGIGGVVQSGNNGFALNTWTHVAAVRNSNTFTLYINGVSVSTTTFSTGGTDGSSGVTIGDYGSGGYAFEGYISNARIVKGTAVYTANFTPSTTPLTAITNTSLLTCADNRFVDDSTNNFTITPTATSVQRFNPFGASAAYSTSVIGGSGYFDGSGDYFLGFYGNVPQDVIEKVGAEMKKAGVKDVEVKKGIISADFTKTGLSEVTLTEKKYYVTYNKGRGQGKGLSMEFDKKTFRPLNKPKKRHNRSKQ